MHVCTYIYIYMFLGMCFQDAVETLTLEQPSVPTLGLTDSAAHAVQSPTDMYALPLSDAPDDSHDSQG